MARDSVAEVRDRTDIVDLIGNYVQLRKAGRSFKGLCPFHQEKTPSFIVFPESQNFRCFGCGKGGDAFTFYMGVENCEFRDALTELARRAGIELSTVPTVAPEIDVHRQKLIELNEVVATFYNNLLVNSAAGAPGRAVAEQRGLSEEMIRKFQIGYAPDSWDHLGRYLAQRGTDASLAVELGLLQQRDTGGHYDKFRSRLIFPIHNRDGRVAGFGGRVIGDGNPKYLNSPQSSIFDKSTMLYGLDLARDEIKKRDEVVIVEGYMDSIAAHQFGHPNVVATMGTALTDQQVDQIKRLTKHIVLALDADAAGQMATVRGLESMTSSLDHDNVPIVDPSGLIRFEKRLNAEIRIVQLPDGKDPDELLRKSPELWPSIVANAQPFLDFFIDVTTRGIDLNDPREKAAVVRRIAPLLRQVGDRVIEAHYVALLAAKLKSSETAIAAEIRSSDARSTIARNRQDVPGPGRAQQIARRVTSEDALMGLMLTFRPHCKDILASMTVEDLSDQRNVALFEVLADMTIPDVDPLQLIAGLDDSIADHAERLMAHVAARPALLPGQVRAEGMQTLVRIRRERNEQLTNQLRSAIADAEREKDRETATLLATQLAGLAETNRQFDPPPSPYFKDLRSTKHPGRNH